MYQIDQEKAQQRLRAEGSMSDSAIEFMLRDFPVLTPPLSEAVEQWLVDGSVKDVSLEGISISQVMANHHAHFLTAVKELHTLLKEGISEEEKEHWRAYLLKQLSFE